MGQQGLQLVASGQRIATRGLGWPRGGRGGGQGALEPTPLQGGCYPPGSPRRTLRLRERKPRVARLVRAGGIACAPGPSDPVLKSLTLRTGRDPCDWPNPDRQGASLENSQPPRSPPLLRGKSLYPGAAAGSHDVVLGAPLLKSPDQPGTCSGPSLATCLRETGISPKPQLRIETEFKYSQT